MKGAIPNSAKWLLVLLLALCAVAASFLQQPGIAATPAVVLVVYVFVQYPQYLLYVLMAAIPWSIEFNLTPTLGTDFPDEQLMWVGSVAAVIFMAHRYSRGQILKINPLLFILALQIIWTAITVFFSTDWLLSLKYLLAKGWYLLSFVALPLFLFKNRIFLKKGAIILTLSMMLFMMVALIRHASYGFSFERVNTALEPFYRNHVNYSALLVVMVPLLWFFSQSAPSLVVKRCVYVLLFLTIIALYLSYARGAWMALIAALFVPFLLRRKFLLGAFVAVLLLSTAGIFWLAQGNRYLKFSNDYNTTIFHTDFKEHLVATYQLKDMSTAERYYRWIAGVRMVEDGWSTGFGPNTFYQHYKSYTVPAFKTWVSSNEEHSTVHNYFLLLLVEQGVIGLLLFTLLLGALYWQLQRQYYRAPDVSSRREVVTVAMMLTMICVVNFLSDLIETDKVGSVFYLCVAVVAGWHFGPQPGEEKTG